MARITYSFLFYLITPLVVIRILWRSLKEPLYRQSIGQRFGYCQPVDTASKVIWIHAVSAGETAAAVPLVKRLLAREYTVVLTTMTATGRERVWSLLSDSVRHYYAPYDMPDAICRFLRRIRPAVLVIIDTELWPNMVHYTRRFGAEVILANARLSERSARRYQRFPMIVEPMLRSVSHVAAQSQVQGERFVALGLAPDKLTVAGSIKFDPALPVDIAGRREQLARKTGNRMVFVAASTHPGEERQVLSAFDHVRAKYPQLLLVLAPRHPRRSEEVQKLCEVSGHRVVRHSSGNRVESQTSVLLLDTMGELVYFYALADIAFIGGSLVPIGGHNIMEAACVGVPVITGPCLRNIDDIAALFLEGGGMRLVQNSDELAEQLTNLCGSPRERDNLVTGAQQVVNKNRGALDTVESLIAHAASDEGY